VNLTDSWANRNRAGAEGGGIVVEAGATANLVNTDVKSNQSGIDGGGIFNQGTVSIDVDSDVSGNKPSGTDCVNSGGAGCP